MKSDHNKATTQNIYIPQKEGPFHLYNSMLYWIFVYNQARLYIKQKKLFFFFLLQQDD